MKVRETPKNGDERETLMAFLDNNRAVMVWKLDGLTEQQARQAVVESGTSVGGVVKHLAYVERWWFDDFFAGNDVEYPWTEYDPDADFRLDDGEGIADVISLYEAAVARSNDIVVSVEMDSLSQRDRGGTRHSMRWIIGHMIEETARHAGHADLARELIDGTTGYLP